MKIHLPNSAFLGNIDPFLESFDPSQRETMNITTNPSWMFVHPIVLSMVASLGLLVDTSNIGCDQLTAKSSHYLERMGLFQLLGIKSGIIVTGHEPSGRFIPLTQIKSSDELTRFLTNMIPLLHLEPRQAETIRYIVSELVRNALEHAQSKNGAIVSAQYYKKSNTIGIGIVDTGLGIKKTMSVSHKVESDIDAIRLALMPGMTGTTNKEGGTELNAGAGLFFIKSIASVNRNFFVLYSGNAMYKLLKIPVGKKSSLHADPFEDRHSTRDDLPYWQGTAAGISVSLDNTPEFSKLLEMIRTTYTQAVRDRRKQRYKKPRFI